MQFSDHQNKLRRIMEQCSPDSPEHEICEALIQILRDVDDDLRRIAAAAGTAGSRESSHALFSSRSL